jgi:hypothetical protein
MASPKKKTDQQAQPTAETRNEIRSNSPLVFISHDTRDADLAEAFGNLLTDASGGVLQSFRSSDRKGTAGIEFGAEWYSAIMSKLSDATDVVALLTAHSLERPWILYEAGVAKGKLDTTVLGLAINIPFEKTTSGPFAQFQNCTDDEDSLTKLVLQLIKRNPQAAPRDEAVRLQVKAFQSNIKTVTEKRAKTPQAVQKIEENAVAKMFEEVKILVRDLPDRVSASTSGVLSEKRKRPRFNPMMFDEILHMSMNGRRSSPVGFLIAFSYLRDSHPWLYELGVQLYAAITARNKARIEIVRRDIIDALDLIRRSSFERESLRSKEDEELFFFIRELTERLEYYLRHLSLGRKPEPFEGDSKDES